MLSWNHSFLTFNEENWMGKNCPTKKKWHKIFTHRKNCCIKYKRVSVKTSSFGVQLFGEQFVNNQHRR